VIRADTLGGLLDVAALLSSQPVPRGRRVAVLTNAGGLGILCADACEAAGLELPQLADTTRAALTALLPPEASVTNPVDMLGSATAESFYATLPVILADPSIDAAIALFVPPVSVETADVGAAISRAVSEADQPDKPVLAAILAADGAPATLRSAANIPSFAYPEAAANALGRAVEHGEWLRRPVGTVPDLAEIDFPAAAAVVTAALAGVDEAWLDPAETRRLLASYGFPLVGELSAATPDEAVAAAKTLGYPSVVKTAAAGIHKTETGGVALNLEGPNAVREAAERIGCPVIVQPMITDGVELLAGVAQDPVFGPLVAFGPGGVLAELIGDARFRLTPLTDVDAAELVTSGKAGSLVAGFRGAPRADATALADVLHRLSRLADDIPELAELDLNPVIGLPDRAVVVDARIRVAQPQVRTDAKSW
jgi:acyl-CoA synthetase (NDP forming)